MLGSWPCEADSASDGRKAAGSGDDTLALIVYEQRKAMAGRRYFCTSHEWLPPRQTQESRKHKWFFRCARALHFRFTIKLVYLRPLWLEGGFQKRLSVKQSYGLWTVVGHISLSGAGVWNGEIIVLNRVWHPRTTLTLIPDSARTRRPEDHPPGTGGAGSPVRSQGWSVDDLSHSHAQHGRDRGRNGPDTSGVSCVDRQSGPTR